MIHRDRHTDTDTERHTDTQTQRDRHSVTDSSASEHAETMSRPGRLQANFLEHEHRFSQEEIYCQKKPFGGFDLQSVGGLPALGIHVPKVQISMQSKTQIQARTHTDTAAQRMHRSMAAHTDKAKTNTT